MSGMIKHAYNSLREFFNERSKTYNVSTDPEFLPDNMGRIDGSSGSAIIEGQCGDNMEMYLIIENGRVKNAVFNTNGCVSSRTCGSIAAYMAVGKSIMEIMRISPGDVLNVWRGIPAGNMHCAILAVSTLHKALADYLLHCRSEN